MWTIWAASIGPLLSYALANRRDAEFNKLADRYFDECVFRFDPVLGTRAGFHQYDGLLAVMTRGEIDEHVSVLKVFEAEIEEFGACGLSAGIAADRELVALLLPITGLASQELHGRVSESHRCIRLPEQSPL
jgi:hypothetical protein